MLNDAIAVWYGNNLKQMVILPSLKMTKMSLRLFCTVSKMTTSNIEKLSASLDTIFGSRFLGTSIILTELKSFFHLRFCQNSMCTYTLPTVLQLEAHGLIWIPRYLQSDFFNIALIVNLLKYTFLIVKSERSTIFGLFSVGNISIHVTMLPFMYSILFETENLFWKLESWGSRYILETIISLNSSCWKDIRTFKFLVEILFTSRYAKIACVFFPNGWKTKACMDLRDKTKMRTTFEEESYTNVFAVFCSGMLIIVTAIWTLCSAQTGYLVLR